MDYLNRAPAQLADTLWQEIDKAAIEAARERLTGRRYLEMEGPFGVGLTAIEAGEDDLCRQPTVDEAGAVMGRAISVPMLRQTFRISVRRIAAHLEHGQPLDVTPVRQAAEAVADREEQFIYQGQAEFQLPGLLTHQRRQRVEGGDWTAVDRALSDVLVAVTRLDNARYRGPYALALAPPLYNGLFRLYPGSDIMQLEHLRRLCTRGIYKAPIEGGVLVDPRVGALVLGQDLRAGYVGQDGVHYEFYLSESIVLRIDEPRAVCVIAATVSSERVAATAMATAGH
ncbi:MAG TPA: family 1 encapsulin nanocompartment shell protein [Stellaceae bacterium]|nr:family 1 encapsulin nanocompartment shell protein [Stellaceae bacterium]